MSDPGVPMFRSRNNPITVETYKQNLISFSHLCHLEALGVFPGGSRGIKVSGQLPSRKRYIKSNQIKSNQNQIYFSTTFNITFIQNINACVIYEGPHHIVCI